MIASALSASLFSAPIVSDDFEGLEIHADWDDPTVDTTILAGVGAEGSSQFATLTPMTGILGAAMEGGASDFFVDFYLRVIPGARQFNFMVFNGETVSDVGASINLRHQNGGWAAYNGSWQSVALPGLAVGSWYHVRITCNGWGSLGANYDIELSDADGAAFTSSVTGLAFYQEGDPNTVTAGAFSFNTRWGNSPGYEIDNVTAETIDVVVLDDPNILVSGSNPFDGLAPGPDPDPITVDLVVENTGVANDLIIEDTSAFSGISAGNFSIITPLPVTIAPGANSIIQLGFDDLDSFGVFGASLTIDSNDVSNPSLVIPVSVTVPSAGGNLLGNHDFEESDTSIPKWDAPGGIPVEAVSGITPGSTVAAQITSLGYLGQSVAGEGDWYMDFFFQVPDTTTRAFNLILNAGAGTSLNLRYRGASEFGENIWNVFTDGDSWGEPLALPNVLPNETYFMRIVGKGWDGATPSYDLLLSDPGSTLLTNKLEGVTRFRGPNPVSGPISAQFSAEFGSSIGFTVDDASFVNGEAPPLLGEAPLAITDLVYDPGALTATITWNAIPGTDYYIYASSDLVNWLELDDSTAASTEETFTETNVPAGARFYRVLDHPEL